MKFVSFSVLFFASFLTGMSTAALAEEITICPTRVVYGTVTPPYGVFCYFNTKPGEEMRASVTYYSRWSDSTLGATIEYGGTIRNGGWTYPEVMASVGVGETRTIKRFITPTRAGSSYLSYDFGGGSNDWIKVSVRSDRSNLRAVTPWIDDNGTLWTPYQITTNTPFKKDTVVVSMRVLALPGGAEILNFPIRHGINMSNFTENYYTLLKDRNPIPKGPIQLEVTVNPEGVFAETTRSDNVSVFDYKEDFFIEKVPDILGNYSPASYLNKLTLGKEFLNRWMDAGVKMLVNGQVRLQIKNEAISGIDWELPFLVPVNTSWFLDQGNDWNSRIRDKFNQLIQRNDTGFWTKAAKDLLSTRVRVFLEITPQPLRPI